MSEPADVNKKPKNFGPPKRFRSIQGIRRFVATVLDRLDKDRDGMTTDKARVLFYGAKILTEMIAESSLEKRIVALELRPSAPAQTQSAIQ